MTATPDGDRFEGKIALVTGASKGIGRAMALRLAREGARVGALARSAETLEPVVSEIHAAGGEGMVLAADVGVAADVEKAIAQLVDEFGGLDLIGHSAGVSWPGKDVIDLTEQDWDMLADTNAKSCYLLAHYGIPHIRARGGGAVVNISSAIATTTAATASGYSAAKASVDTFTRAVAIETAQYGIRVNAVAPGIVLTPMVEADAERSDLESEEYLETLEKIAPLGRLITAEEVASLALYLLSDEASAITGSVHKVDGGWTAQINLGEVF